jgi:uncharacterized damage-inducible protein DinB
MPQHVIVAVVASWPRARDPRQARTRRALQTEYSQKKKENAVNRVSFLIFAACLLFAAASTNAAPKSGPEKPAHAQPGQAQAAAPAQQPKDTTPPSYDMKPQSLLDLEALNKKFVSLAEALPADKFNWKPADGTRTFAQLFLHVSGERYGFLGLLDAPKPEGIDFKTYEKSTTDKTEVIAQLNKSWEYTRDVINKMSNADFAHLRPKLGPDANDGDVVYLLVADAHEHMGQAVAYARMNNITPPWTVAAQAAAAKQKDGAQKP